MSEAGDLTGRTVLLTHEEGFGDTMQFLRYAPLLAQRGARVLAWVPGPLVRLVQSVAGVAAVFTGDGAPPPFDFHCPFVSLPRVFETTVATVPGEPYLAADPDARWPPGRSCCRLLAMRVGLAWAGQNRPWLPGLCHGGPPAQRWPGRLRAAWLGAGRAVRQPAEGSGAGAGRAWCAGVA